MGDLARPAAVPCDVIDGAHQVVPNGGRCVNKDNALSGREEHGLVERVGHPVQVVVDASDEVAVRVKFGPDGLRRDRCVIR